MEFNTWLGSRNEGRGMGRGSENPPILNSRGAAHTPIIIQAICTQTMNLDLRYITFQEYKQKLE